MPDEIDALLDERIRAAYETIAATAPSPERVRARLAARGRFRVERRALLIGAGALGTAAAAGVPIALLGRPDTPAPQPAPAAPSESPSPAPAARVERVMFPLVYGPTWLPDGLVERYRSVRARATGTGLKGTGSRRVWTPPGVEYDLTGTAEALVSLAVDERIDDDSGSTVTIGDVKGRLRVTDGAFVEWTPLGGPTMIVNVYGLPNQVDVALRIARAVEGTPQTTAVTIRSPWVPPRFTGWMFAGARPTAGGWRMTLTHSSADYAAQCQIVASTGAGGVASAASRQVGDVLLAVTLGNGGPTPQEAERLLDELVFAAPDLSWAGVR